MPRLSTRAKEAIKPALAMVIAYGISLGMGWENPYWAGFAVAMISLSTVGQSVNKGVLRLLGTLMAVVAALTFSAWFIQERWLYILVLSIYLGVCVYKVTGKVRTYFWWCSAFVCLVIAVHAAANPLETFDIAVLRMQQTAMGIVVYTLVALFLWPSDTRGALEETTRKLFTIQATLYRSYRDLLRGHASAEDSHPLRMQEVGLLNQHEQVLRGAETDSYEVWEIRAQWRWLHNQSTALMEALGYWRESFAEIQPLDLDALFPDLETVCTEIDLRFQEIERMLGGEAPSRSPQPVTLAMDDTAMSALTHFQKAAVAMSRVQIHRIEALSRSLFDCVADIKGVARQSSSGLQRAGRAGGGPGLDPDRLEAAVRTVAIVWIAFIIWFQLDPPGHAGFVELAIIFFMASAMAHVSPGTITGPFLLGALFSGILYIFVMPHLSGYLQLGTMIFGATFAIYYVLWQPRQGLGKVAAIVQFLNVIGVQNQQTYDFAAFANTLVMLALAGMLAVAVTYIPPSPRPEKMFLRLLARFFRHSEYLMSRLAMDWDLNQGIADRWKTMYYRADLLGLSQKVGLWGGKVDTRAFPDNSPEQVQALVTSLQAFAIRIKELAEMRDLPQADLLVRELLEDVRAWRLVFMGQLQLWGDDPALAIGSSAEMRERLTGRLNRLESRVDETFRRLGGGSLASEDYENFYRLLAGFRGVSEAGIGYARVAEKINWAQWQQARF